MPTLLEYISQLQREHRYRIKMAFAPTEKQIEVLERHMRKYDALEVGRPEKLMLQATPMDFPQLAGHEIVIVDVVTRLPVSTPMLAEELCSLMFVKSSSLRVFGRDEPIEKQIEAAESDKKQAEPITGADYTANEANPVSAEDAAGDKYVQNLLTDLAKVSADKKSKITSAPAFETPADGKVSPIGSVQNKIPSPLKGKK